MKQTILHGSPETLVFYAKDLGEIRMRSPEWGCQF